MSGITSVRYSLQRLHYRYRLSYRTSLAISLNQEQVYYCQWYTFTCPKFMCAMKEATNVMYDVTLQNRDIVLAGFAAVVTVYIPIQ